MIKLHDIWKEENCEKYKNRNHTTVNVTLKDTMPALFSPKSIRFGPYFGKILFEDFDVALFCQVMKNKNHQ